MTGMLLLAALSTSPLSPTQVVPKDDVVLRWNETTLEAIRAARTPPPQAARHLAMVHAAVYDAVNAVERTHQPYRVEAKAPPGTSATAAAAVAAHRVLLSLYPAQVARFDKALDDCCADIPEGKSRDDGVALGLEVAEKILELRAGDGAAKRVAHAAGKAPGEWRPTPPGFRAALLPQWPRLTCFAMERGTQFRSLPPPAMTSAAYTASFREVKALGSVNSKARTAEQTEIARFWADGDGTVTPPGHWNRIAQTAARARGTTLAENARLFALLNLALADAGIVAWDCKYEFNLWRPVQGIREADTDGNPDTDADPDWTPLLETPPFPSYVSGHSTFSGAAAAVLACFFGTDELRFTSTSEGLPGVVRSFRGFWEAAAEAGKSRIYGGIHWEFDNAEGLAAGRALGNYVCGNFLTARR
jgi:hypothetical protein